MRKEKRNHINPRENGWAFIKAGNTRATFLHNTHKKHLKPHDMMPKFMEIQK